MKNTLIVVFVAITIALGAACFVQWQKLTTQKAQMLSLNAAMAQKAEEIAELQAAHNLDEKQRQELAQQAGDLANKLQVRLQADAKVAAKTPAGGVTATDGQKPAKDKEGFGSFLTKMMEDPDT